MEFISVAYKICRARKFEKLPRVLERKHHLKIELYVRLRVLFRVVHVVQNRRSALLLGTSGFHLKVKNKRFNAAASRCRQNLKYENFTSSCSRLRQKHYIKKRAARASRLFFLILLIQPIKSVIFGVVVAVAISFTSLMWRTTSTTATIIPNNYQLIN